MNINQHDLFAQLEDEPMQENAPDLDLILDMQAAIKQAIRACPFSREQIVDRMNLCLRASDLKVTYQSFNKWIAPSQSNAMPAHFLPAFCWATQTIYPFEVLLSPLNYKTADMRADLLSEIGAKRVEAAKAAREAKRMESMMQTMLNNTSVE